MGVTNSKFVGMNVGMSSNAKISLIKITETDKEVLNNIILDSAITTNDLSKILKKSTF